MNSNIPEMQIARGPRGASAFGPPPDAAYVGTPIAPANPGFVAVTPPQQIQAGRSDASRRALGLVPAQAGGLHPLVLRDRPSARVDPKEVSRMRAEKRGAEAKARLAEAALIHAAGTDLRNTSSPDYNAKLLESRDAQDLVAALTRKLGELESAAVSRPTQVILAIVREPAEVPDALADTDRPTWWVCLHDGCKHERWSDEGAMRRAHPTHAEMTRSRQTHVYALLSEAPLDPLDPGAGTVGFIAPIGKDGTKVEMIAGRGIEGESVEDLRATVATQGTLLAEMRAEIAALRSEKKPKA